MFLEACVLVSFLCDDYHSRLSDYRVMSFQLYSRPNWQGEILSLFLFCIFLNNLESVLLQNNVSLIRRDVNNEESLIFLKLLLLLYADGTVYLAIMR